MAGLLRRRGTQRSPQSTSEGRASGNMQACSLCEAETNSKAGYTSALRAFFRDLMKYSG